jgi:hypothetical protein
MTGVMSSLSRKKVLMCTEKRELAESPLSKYRGFVMYSMNKTEGRIKNVYN